MKSLKLLGIIAFVVVIGFSLLSCRDTTGSDSVNVPTIFCSDCSEVIHECICIPPVQNQNPVASDFIVSNLMQTAGNVTAVTIIPQTGKSTGVITVFYDGSTTLPTTVGTYQVTFNVAASTGWNAVNGLAGGTLTVNAQIHAQTPTITSQPASATLTFNTSHDLSVTASVNDGGELTYQWYSNNSVLNNSGTIINNATSDSYSPPTGIEGTYYYFVEITNTITDNGDGGNKIATRRSNIVTLIVNSQIHAQTPNITNQSTSATIIFNAMHNLTVVANVNDDGELTYQWYKSNSVSNSGGTPIDNNATSVFYYPPTGTAGTYYYFVEVTNTITDNGDGGNKIATIRSNVITLTIATPSTFDIKLIDMNEWDLTQQTTTAFTNVDKAFSVTGSYSTYRWYIDGTLTGSSSSFTFNKPSGVYELVLVVTNSSGESRSGRCWVTVNEPSLIAINIWKDGNFDTRDQEEWFAFPVISGTTYRVWWNDSGNGSGKTCNVAVSARYKGSSSWIFGGTNTSVDSGYSTAQSFTANQTGMVEIRVIPYNRNSTGTYGIVYSNSATRP